MPIPLVTINHVSLFLSGDASQTFVLHDICWQLEHGGHCALIGRNGAGKSTLLRLLRGELWPAMGHIYWHTGEGPEGGAEESPLAGRSISALVSPAQQEEYQRQAWDITGKELLLTGFDDSPLLYSDAPASQQSAVSRLAAQLHIEDLLERTIPTLSQGQLRILLLGRALLREPALLLLDECADGLDTLNRRRFFEALESVVSACTVVMTAHRPNMIPLWCTQRLHVKEGRLFALERAQQPKQKQARKRAVSPPSSPQPVGRMLFSLENADVYIDREKVLHNINWRMHEGEHWRITGANGSGKSTLLRLLAGDEFVAAGGTLCRTLPRQGGTVETLDKTRKGVRLVSDLSQALYSYELTALELVCTGFDNTIGVYREYSAEERSQALKIMQFLGMATLTEHSIRMLSSGQVRRLFLARALTGEPDILLLDEPCSNLDAESRAIYLDILDELAAQGTHLIFVSHHEGDAPMCINREARIKDGRLRVVR